MSDNETRREFFNRTLGAASGIALTGLFREASAQQPPQFCPAVPNATAATAVPYPGGAMPQVAGPGREISRGADGILRATIAVMGEPRSVWQAQANTATSNGFAIPACRTNQDMRYFAGYTADGAKVWPKMMGVPGPGPTLRARVGDTVQITLLNQVDPKEFALTLDVATEGGGHGCDTANTTIIDPATNVARNQQIYPMNDQAPDCFHGSSSANLHFHGFHVSPSTISDNVLVQVRPSPRDPKTNQPIVTEATVHAWFAQVFDAAMHGHGPQKWEDLPQGYRDLQKKYLQEYDTQVPGAQLWTSDEAAIAAGQWPQYYVGAYPNSFKITEYNQALTAHDQPLLPGQQAPKAKMGQAPGTHWYHAHKHGSTALNVFNGMAGAFIIEGEFDDQLNAFYRGKGPGGKGLTEQVLVIQQLGSQLNLLNAPQPNRAQTGTTKEQFVFVNGFPQPQMTMQPGEIQRWRILNLCTQVAIGFAGFQANGSPAPAGTFSWKQIAQDGVQFNWDNYNGPANSNPAFVMTAANRVDLLIQAPNTAGNYSLMVYHEPFPPGFATAPLLTIQVGGARVTDMAFPSEENQYPKMPEYLHDIDPKTIHIHREVTFNTEYFGNDGRRGLGPGRAQYPSIKPSRHTIDGKQFENQIIDQVMLLNSAEEWTLINTTQVNNIPGSGGSGATPLGYYAHPFHIHINPFQVIEIFDPVTMWEPRKFDKNFVWYDTIGVPPAYNYYPDGKRPRLDKDGNQVFVPGYVKMRSRFVDFTGLYVFHCHILAHEDRGMMQLVEVVSNETIQQHH